MMRIYVEGVGLCGPGLPSWEAARPMLTGQAAYVAAEAAPPPSALLPPNERRRAAQIVKFALAVATEAFAASGRDPKDTPTIFTSSGGDGDTIHAIMSTLASPARELSPTRFHNSVHNAAAGYWSILSGAKAASTSLCCHDGSFAAGLLEAAAQLAAGAAAVALIAYDVRYPSPLAEMRPIEGGFAAALILSPQPDTGAASLEVTLLPEAREPAAMPMAALEYLRASTPAARCLPLLAALAEGASAAEITLDYLEDMALALRLLPKAGA